MTSLAELPTTFLVRLGRLFYIVDPRTTYFETVEDVPDYITEAIPYFIFTIVLEVIVAFFSKEHRPLRINDGIGSMSAGLIQQIFNKMVSKGFETATYVWCFERFKMWDLPCASIWTWVLGFFLIDFGYYWFHRMAHEINIFWAAHVVHHSSEEYNQSTALRQSALQTYTSFIFYLPFAVALPPPMFVVHRNFNTLFQYWIHTEIIGNLGPLEWFLNTPSHHRVHHGRNPYCIDKNYAGTLIIWDRLFGTFQAENLQEPVVFGITHPLNSFDPFYIQTHHLVHIFRTAWTTPGLMNKVYVFLKGPGWAPGKPRLGLIEDIPVVHAPHPSYDPVVAPFINIYALAHFFLTIAVYLSAGPVVRMGGVYMVGIFIYVFFTLTALGAMFDRTQRGIILELTRLVASVFLCLTLIYKPYDITLPALARLGQTDKTIMIFGAFQAVSAVLVLGRWIIYGKAFYGTDKTEFSINPKSKAARKLKTT